MWLKFNLSHYTLWLIFDTLSITMNVFAKRLKEERERKGLTQKEMAQELGIPFDTYRNYESPGKRHCEPNIETISKIADILQVSIDYLAGRNNKKSY